MFSLNFFLVLALVCSIAHAKIVSVKNAHRTPIVVTVGSDEYTLLPFEVVAVSSAEEFSGTITAVPAEAGASSGPRTQVDISVSPAGDSYSVSLVNGFNIGANVIPTGSANCTVAVCAANLLRTCPLENRVVDDMGAVVGCQNSPIIFSKICPHAVVDDVTAALNVQSCSDAVAYLVIFV